MRGGSKKEIKSQMSVMSLSCNLLKRVVLFQPKVAVGLISSIMRCQAIYYKYKVILFFALNVLH